MRYLKIFGLTFVVWIVGVVICGAWMIWDLRKNPVPPNPDGSIPDSIMIPLMRFAFLLAIVLILANLAAFVNRRFKLPSNQ